MEEVRIYTSQFGSTTKYFQLFLDSCWFNPSVKWVLYTDFNEGSYIFPPNVIVRRVTLSELKQRLQASYPFQVRFSSAKDFAAFRPLYGNIFSDELKGFRYWGACDCDVIWGDLSMVTNACDGVVDKIMPKGHLFLIRNDIKLNNFLNSHPKLLQAIDNNLPALPVVEEEEFPRILRNELRATMNDEIPFVQANPRLGHFRLIDTYAINKVLGIGLGAYDSVPYVATWRKGKLHGWFLMPNGTVRVVELAYIHFFKREMSVECSRLERYGNYLIVPNRIYPYDGHELSRREIVWLNRPRVHWFYYRARLNWPTILRKLKKVIHK